MRIFYRLPAIGQDAWTEYEVEQFTDHVNQKVGLLDFDQEVEDRLASLSPLPSRQTDYSSNELRDQAGPAPADPFTSMVDEKLATLQPLPSPDEEGLQASVTPAAAQSFAEFMAQHEEKPRGIDLMAQLPTDERETEPANLNPILGALDSAGRGVAGAFKGAVAPIARIPEDLANLGATIEQYQGDKPLSQRGTDEQYAALGDIVGAGASLGGDVANVLPGWAAGNAQYNAARGAITGAGIVPEDSPWADAAAMVTQAGGPMALRAGARVLAPELDNALAQIPKYGEQIASRVGSQVDEAGGLVPFLERGTATAPSGPSFLPAEAPKPRPQVAAGVSALPGESVAEASAAGQVANLTLGKFDPSLQEILTKAVDRLSPEAVDAARRGEIGEDALRSLAGKVGMTTDQFIKKARPGKAYSGEELLALDEALATTAREIRDIAGKLGDPEQATDALRAEFAALSLQATGLSRAAVGGRAEAGRALNAMRYLRAASDSPTRLKKALEMVGDSASDPAVMQRIAEAADDPVELFGLIRNMQKPNFRDRFGTYYRANLLSSPLTQVRNITGNVGALAFILPERAAAAAVDAARSLVTRTPRERFMGEVPAQAEGMIAGFGSAVRRAGDVLTRGYTAEDALKLEQAGRFKPFGMGIVGKAVEAPFRALSAGDAFFRTLAESGELWTLAYRHASREGLKGDALRARAIEIAQNPPANVMEQVAQAGAYRTYTQTLDKYGQALSGMARLPGGEFLMPFISTPWNIAKYELERSPLGALSVGKAIVDKKAGGEIADRAGRMLLGSGIAASFYMYALGDNMTAKPPDNPTERDLFYREGKQPFSIRIGDQWHSYAQFTGISSTLALAAAAADASRRLGTAPTEREAMRIVAEAASVMTEKPFLQGLKSLQDMIESPDKAGQIIENTARGLVPGSSLLGAAARSVDPTMREAEGVKERVQAGMPGLSQQLPEKLDAFGRPVQREQAGLEALVNPIQRTSAKNDPIDAELRRLTGDTGDAAGPSPITRSTKIAGRDLDRAQRRALQEINGPMAYDALARLFGSGAYLRAKSDAERVELVRREMARVRAKAGEEVIPPVARAR